ncbi:hypothetical protein GCM10010315_13080 [Streptomyces luteosporeus]|uniref:Uncharacterized protein n=1 Tax=Streptomyces luteosporeus TaxID=173856 RepID=A0ABP6G1L1_9ACTN
MATTIIETSRPSSRITPLKMSSETHKRADHRTGPWSPGAAASGAAKASPPVFCSLGAELPDMWDVLSP